ncbi:MAG TPA: FAD-dependent oxidoreductase [Opitutaceae bacterium]|nr:FAD-dependent oxidoreductase [Opitutaceae bacterium]HPG16981.1 FAD-dependent oxidoreductase [Opitutaceae bacterium]HPN99718.1 FAD-dependent oxidoreductase [Opitutaceae bacterium]
MSASPLRLVIIGGVAAGASVAARARRLSESAQITLIERGPDVSFANCGLPYHIGGEIPDRAALAVQTPQSLKAMLDIDVRTGTEAVAIDRSGKRVQLRTLATGEETWLPYDKLVLAPGASPLRPPLPGIDHPRVHTLRSLQDMDRLKAASADARRVVVIGAGFIGLEMVEQFIHLKKEVALVELLDQLLPPLDKPMTLLMEDELKRHGVELHLGDAIAGFAPACGALACQLKSGRSLPADLVVLAIGVRPETALAKAAGLALGPRGHIRTDAFLRTDDPDIYAAGDAAEIRDFVTDEPTAVPLGGPANRQGRAIADHIFRPASARPIPGALGTAIVRAFTVAAGLTGWSEKRLRAAGRTYRTVTVNGNHHADYYPGAQPIILKLLWDPADGRILGAQASGLAGIDKRLDTLATAIAGHLTIDDLAQLELSYAPPFGSAKDLVNLAGMAACNARDGLVDPIDTLPDDPAVQIVDVRPAPLAQKHPIPRPGVINLPLGTLRQRATELDPARPVVTVCALGKSSYFAARILAQRGFSVRAQTGGLRAILDPRSPAKHPAP